MQEGDGAAPDVSVCIPTLNPGKRILDCLEALYQSAGSRKLEVFVYDNGSSDGTFERIRDAYPKVSVIRSERNRYFVDPNNAMIERTRGDSVFLLSDDVKLRDKALDRLVRFLENHPSAGAVAPKSLDENGEPEQIAKPHRTFRQLVRDFTLLGYPLQRWTSDDVTNHVHGGKPPYRAEVLQNSSLLIRREALRSLDYPLDPNLDIFLSEDDFAERLKKEGWELYYQPEIVVEHLGQETLNRLSVRERHDVVTSDLIHFTREHHGPFQAHLLMRPLRYLDRIRAILTARRKSGEV